MSPEFLTAVAWKATLILAAACGAGLLLRRSPAAVRHLAWVLASVSALALPVLYRWAPAWNVAPSNPAVMITDAVVSAPVPVSTPTSSPIPWTAVFWAAGAMVAGLRLARSLWRVNRASLNASAPASETDALGARMAREIGLAAVPRIAVSARVPVPFTWGLIRPAILLPASAANWDASRLRVVLLHEFMHVKRLDWLSQMLVESMCVLYWFHPLAWWAAREARRAGEQACDDAVLRHGTRSTEYAEHLLAVARSIQGTVRQPAVVAMALRSHLEDRLRAMLDRTRSRRSLTRAEALGAALACVLLLAPLAAIHAQSSATSGTLAGTVYDPSGAVVPNARVIAVGVDTKNREITTANPAGEFSFESIPSGRYTLEVRSRGFKLAQQSVVVKPNQKQMAKVTLDIGQIDESIDIVAKGSRPQAPVSGTPQRIRVGGSLQATKILKMVRPTYPEHAKALGIEGAVLLQAVIGRDGALMSVTPLNTLADPELQKAAIDAVSQWRYQPTLLNGVAVEVITNITVNFKLEE